MTASSPAVAERAAALELGDGVEATPVGLTFTVQPDFEHWAWVGTRLGNLVNASAWWVADWLLHGFTEYGALANQAAEKFGLDPHTLTNYRAVAQRVEMSLRKDNLSFSHHALVAYLDPEQQTLWLDRAIEHGWSWNQLRLALQGHERELVPAEPRDSPDLELLKLTIPATQAQTWKAAADKHHMSFNDWATETLDHAAQAA